MRPELEKHSEPMSDDVQGRVINNAENTAAIENQHADESLVEFEPVGTNYVQDLRERENQRASFALLVSETSWDALILSEEVGDSFTENDALHSVNN